MQWNRYRSENIRIDIDFGCSTRSDNAMDYRSDDREHLEGGKTEWNVNGRDRIE